MIIPYLHDLMINWGDGVKIESSIWSFLTVRPTFRTGSLKIKQVLLDSQKECCELFQIVDERVPSIRGVKHKAGIGANGRFTRHMRCGRFTASGTW